jgi:hypothetical protein
MRHPFIILILFFLPFWARAQAPGTQAPKGPVLSFEGTVHDYGIIEQGANGRCTFRFTNTGDEPLIIERCMSSCGCLVPSWDREPVPPGGGGSVRLQYDTSRVGPFRKSMTVQSNSVAGPVQVLQITGEVRPRPVTVVPAGPEPSR